MQSYNGWTGAQRTSRLAELRVATSLKTLPPHIQAGPGPCEICGQTRNTMWHAEQYGPTWEAYLDSFHALCGHCHAMLHLRFRFPNRWKFHLHHHADWPADNPAPAAFVPNVGAIFARARHWKDLEPALVKDYSPTSQWFHHLPAPA